MLADQLLRRPVVGRRVDEVDPGIEHRVEQLSDVDRIGRVSRTSSGRACQLHRAEPELGHLEPGAPQRRRRQIGHRAPHTLAAARPYERPSRDATYDRTMTRLERIAPVLPVSSVAEALAGYAKLGFRAREYVAAADDYGFLDRDGVQLHVCRVDDLDPTTSTVAVYLYVDDADALLAEWRASGAAGRFHDTEDTPYGLREGAYVDPDGNLIRFGSELGNT